MSFIGLNIFSFIFECINGHFHFFFISIYFLFKQLIAAGFFFTAECLFYIKSYCLSTFSDSDLPKTSEGSEDSDCERVRLTDINDKTKNDRIQ